MLNLDEDHYDIMRPNSQNRRIIQHEIIDPQRFDDEYEDIHNPDDLRSHFPGSNIVFQVGIHGTHSLVCTHLY